MSCGNSPEKFEPTLGIPACKTIEAAAEEAGHQGMGHQSLLASTMWLRARSALWLNLGEAPAVVSASCIHQHR